jgi:hypothetical protein
MIVTLLVNTAPNGIDVRRRKGDPAGVVRRGTMDDVHVNGFDQGRPTTGLREKCPDHEDDCAIRKIVVPGRGRRMYVYRAKVLHRPGD